jgi:hypothetical protein
MQAAILPITAGWVWIQDGFQLFRRQPMAMFFWSMTTGLLITISYLIPLFGQIALIACTPMLTFITLSACRNIAQGRPMLLNMWLQPLKKTDTRKRLLKLGMAYLLCCLTAGFIATLPFLGQLMASIDENGVINEQALLTAMQGPFITFGLLYLAISALFWHAPALIGWHGIKMSQALFYSMVACWRNKWPFLAYGASWAAIFFAAQMTGMLLTSIGASVSLVQILLTPVNIVIAAVLYCSFYPAYVSVFGNDYPIESTPS